MRIGILGGGQLAQMLAWSVKPLGLDVWVLDEDQACPASRAAHVFLGSAQKEHDVHRFADQMDVLTLESEQIDARVLDHLDVPCWPHVDVLRVAQNRIHEKNFFREHGLPVAPFMPLASRAGLDDAATALGFPFVLKSASGGYDGKAQVVFDHQAACDAWSGEAFSWPAVAEAWLACDAEVSVAVVRAQDAEVRTYPLSFNRHVRGILHEASPDFGTLSAPLRQQAEAVACKLAALWDYVGVLVVEFFVASGALYVNECAPRVHNSLHWSLEASMTSQFENHMRAVAGLPLGRTDAVKPVVMHNCLGGVPALKTVCAVPGARLHDYGKKARPGRKCGHITVLASDEAALKARSRSVVGLLRQGGYDA